MPRVLIDARDAVAAPLRGWGRYALELVRALPEACSPDLEVAPIVCGGPLPEVAFEQLGLPLRALRHSADVIHAPNVWLPLVRPCAGVVTIHDLAFEAMPEDFSRVTGAKYRALAPRAARSAEGVICVSQFTADDVCTRYGVDPERVHVVPNGPALPIGTSSAPVGRGEYLLAVGDLRAKKNLDRLVAAWAAGAGGGRRLVLAGAGAPSPSWPAGVEVTGYVDDAELDALIRGAALLVHPSLYEGFGIVMAEAFARGTPVACSATTALPETADGAAELFDPLDVDAIGAAIDRALSAGRSEQLRALGLARAQELTWSRAAALTADVYRAVLHG